MAYVNAIDNNGKTALHWAVGRNHNPAIARALIVAGADVRIRDNGGSTPLDSIRYIPDLNIREQIEKVFLGDTIGNHSIPIV